jgi:hypothetical protein
MHQPRRFVGERGLGGAQEETAWLLVDVVIHKELILTVISKDA